MCIYIYIVYMHICIVGVIMEVIIILVINIIVINGHLDPGAKVATDPAPASDSLSGMHAFGRFPKFHRAFLGRDPGTLKSDIVSKKNNHN